MLLLLGGDVELNPGDDVQPKCDLCMNLVGPQESVVICQECNVWFHKSCCAFHEAANDVLSSSFCAWLCPKCDSPNYLESFLNASLDSLISENSFEPLNEQFQVSSASSHCVSHNFHGMSTQVNNPPKRNKPPKRKN